MVGARPNRESQGQKLCGRVETKESKKNYYLKNLLKEIEQRQVRQILFPTYEIRKT